MSVMSTRLLDVGAAILSGQIQLITLLSRGV